MPKIIPAAAFLFLFSFSVRAQQIPSPKDSGEKSADCAELAAKVKKMEGWEKVSQDWPNLARYRDANAMVPPPAKDEQRVVFMGDSITDIWGNPQFGPFFPGKPYINRGIGGQTTPQMLVRFRPDVIELHPKVVVILAGTNDIAGNTGPMTIEETEQNLASMIELARQHDVRVVLASVTPVVDGVPNPKGGKFVQTEKRPPESILKLNDWIKKYCADYGHIYLDYFSAMVDEKGFLKPDLTFDGLHPNAAGFAVMGPLAEKAIQGAIAKKP